VPSVQIARPDGGDPVQVTAGAARFEPAWCDDRTVCDWCDCEDCGAGVDGPLPCEGHGNWEPAAAVCQNATRPHRLRVGWDSKGKWRWITRRYFDMEEEQLQAHIRKYQIVERLQAAHQRQRNSAGRRTGTFGRDPGPAPTSAFGVPPQRRIPPRPVLAFGVDDAVSSQDLTTRVDELTQQNHQLADQLQQVTTENTAFHARVTQLEDDLAAARTSLRRMTRDENRNP
jgi:hypothetical protein